METETENISQLKSQWPRPLPSCTWWEGALCDSGLLSEDANPRVMTLSSGKFCMLKQIGTIEKLMSPKPKILKSNIADVRHIGK